jgi:anti-sigma factor RsiW
MVEILERRLAAEPAAARRLVEPVRQDIRRLHLDRLYRLVCLPFNTLLMLSLWKSSQRSGFCSMLAEIRPASMAPMGLASSSPSA